MADEDPLSHEGIKMWEDANSERFFSQSSVPYRKKSPNAATAAGARWTEPSYRANSVATSPNKKVKRSSGDILEATGEDGRVMPELLAEQGGAKWPRASCTTKVLTFGASWDNRSDVDFLNKNVLDDVLDVGGAAKGAGLSLSTPDAATKGYVKGGAVASYRRRHSEPISTTAVAALSPLASAQAQGSSQGSPLVQSRALGPEGSSAVLAPANTNKTNKRRAGSTGGIGIVTREGTGAAFEASSFPAGSGANSMIATGVLMEGGGKESEMDRFLEEEEPSFQPEVDIVDMARMGMGLSASPAASVESGFWDDGDGDGDGEAGNEIVEALLGQNTIRSNRSMGGGSSGSSQDPKEAAHAALNRLMAKCIPMSTSDACPRDGSVNALENLLLDLQPHQGASLEAPAGVSAGDVPLTEAKTREHYTARLPVPYDIPVTPAGASNANKTDTKTCEIKLSNPTPDSSRSGGDHSATSPGGDESSSSPGSSAAAALDPALWKLVERGDTCPFEGCAFTVQAAEEKERTKLGLGAAKAEGVLATSVAFGAASSAIDSGGGSGEHQEDSGIGRLVDGREGKENLTKNRSRCRHFHTLCGCRHTRGALKGLLFQTNQLDKARNHQKKHASAAAASSGNILATPTSQGLAGLTSSMSSGLVGVGTEGQDLSQVSQDTSRTLNSTLNSSGDYDDEEQNPDNSYNSLDVAELELDVDGILAGDDEGYILSASIGDEGRGKRKRRTTINKGVKEKSDRAKDGRRTWTDKESGRLREAMEQQDAGETRRNWTWVAARVSEAGGGRKTPSQCKMRWERIVNPDVKRGLWTKEEDDKLKQVAAAMDHKWSHVARLMGGRTYKQCRERYTNYLKEGLNCGPWTEEEDAVLLEVHSKIGNRWAEIARHLKDRSENMIKNQFMKLSREASHKRKSWSDLGDSDSGHCLNLPEVKKPKKRGRPKGVKNASDIATSKDRQSPHVSGEASVDHLDNNGAISVNDASIYCASNRNNASAVDIAVKVGSDVNIDTASYIYKDASSLEGGNASNSRDICNLLF